MQSDRVVIFGRENGKTITAKMAHRFSEQIKSINFILGIHVK